VAIAVGAGVWFVLQRKKGQPVSIPDVFVRKVKPTLKNGQEKKVVEAKQVANENNGEVLGKASKPVKSANGVVPNPEEQKVGEKPGKKEEIPSNEEEVNVKPAKNGTVARQDVGEEQ
jgi:hypothetical protein